MAANQAQGFIEDVHICGACREEFHDVELFIVHKRTGCPQFAKRLQCQQGQLLTLSSGQNVVLPSSLPSQMGQVVLARMSSQTCPSQHSQTVLATSQSLQATTFSQPSLATSTYSQSNIESQPHNNTNPNKIDLIQPQHGQEVGMLQPEVSHQQTLSKNIYGSQSQHTELLTKSLKTESLSTTIKAHVGNSISSFDENVIGNQKQSEVQNEVNASIIKEGSEKAEFHAGVRLKHQDKEGQKSDQPHTEVSLAMPHTQCVTITQSPDQADFVADSVLTTMTTVREACNPVAITENSVLSTSGSVNSISSGHPQFISAGQGEDTQLVSSVAGLGMQPNPGQEMTTSCASAPQITLDLASLMTGLTSPGLTQAESPNGTALSISNDQNNTENPENSTAGTPPGTIQITLSPGANNVTVLTQNLPATIQAALQAGLGQFMSQSGQFTPATTTANIEAEKLSAKSNTASNTAISSKKVRYETYQLPAERPKIITVAPKKYQCDYKGCGYSTSYQKDLERHQRIHTGEKPYECTLCGKAYNRSDKLRIHERNHSGLKPYKCQHCEYSTSDSSSLKKHLRIHTDERPFRCQICPYASRNSSQLIVHLRTHTGDCPFVCHICNAKFKINSDLKRHMRLHTGEKPYQCDMCDYKCAIKGNLKSHYRINHSHDNMVNCKDCGYQTSSRKAYREHMKSHEPNYHYSCQYCAYTCVSRATLRTHLRIHSDDKPYRCDYCNYATKQSGNVKMHMKRRHPGKFSTKLAGKGKEKDCGPGGNIGIPSACADVGNLSPSSPRKQIITVAPMQTSPDLSQNEESGTKRTTNIRPVCKKLFKCPQCDLSFVREDSLRCHLRCHKETDSVIAQAVENAAFAVLQLQHPISNSARKEGEEAEGQGMSQMIEGDQSYQACVGSDTNTGGGPPPATQAITKQDDTPASGQDSTQILQTALSQSNITPLTLQQTQQPHQQQTHHNLKNVMSVAPTTCTSQPHQVHSSIMAAHSENQHHDSMLNQAASNLMAFMQNNQNMAVEDNIQNHAISSRQRLSQPSQPSTTEVPFSTHTINHHPVHRVSEHHYAHQSMHPQQIQQRYPEQTQQPQQTHPTMGRPINLSMGTGIPLNVHIMGSNPPPATSQAPPTCTAQHIQFILPCSVPMAMANNTTPMDTSVISVPQQLVLNLEGQRGGYNQSSALTYASHQQPVREVFAPTVSHGNHLIDIPPPIATVDFSSLASPPCTTAKSAK